MTPQSEPMKENDIMTSGKCVQFDCAMFTEIGNRQPACGFDDQNPVPVDDATTCPHVSDREPASWYADL